MYDRVMVVVVLFFISGMNIFMAPVSHCSYSSSMLFWVTFCVRSSDTGYINVMFS